MVLVHVNDVRKVAWLVITEGSALRITPTVNNDQNAN